MRKLQLVLLEQLLNVFRSFRRHTNSHTTDTNNPHSSSCRLNYRLRIFLKNDDRDSVESISQLSVPENQLPVPWISNAMLVAECVHTMMPQMIFVKPQK